MIKSNKKYSFFSEKIQASTILESMLAMVIIGIVISTAINLFVAVPKNSFLERDQLAYAACSSWFEETLTSKEYLDEMKKFDAFDLERVIVQKDNLQGMVLVKIIAKDKFGEVITSRKRMVKKE